MRVAEQMPKITRATLLALERNSLGAEGCVDVDVVSAIVAVEWGSLNGFFSTSMDIPLLKRLYYE